MANLKAAKLDPVVQNSKLRFPRSCLSIKHVGNSVMEFHGENKARSVMLIAFKRKEGSWTFDGEIKQKDAIP
jgi:hypothetical protein